MILRQEWLSEGDADVQGDTWGYFDQARNWGDTQRSSNQDRDKLGVILE